MKKFLFFIVLAISSIYSWAGISMDGKASKWNGFKRIDFKFENRSAILVSPKVPRGDNAWVLRPAFFGAFPKADVALLEKGFYVAYFDVTHDYANPKSRELMNKFYALMTDKYKLHKKVALEGLSRGGAFSLIWANDDPSKIACVYVDNPVCDFRQWPVKKAPTLIAGFREKWNLREGEELTFKNNPIDNLERLAKSGVAMLMIIGDKDTTTPFEKHGKIYKERFFDSGGNLRLIVRKGKAHHPHGLDDPSEIVQFIEQAYKENEAFNRTAQDYKKFNVIKNRAGIKNAFEKFSKTRSGTVAFVGGSITEMKGWKELVSVALQKRFPQTKFNFIYSGISSLGSTPHAFRLSSDIPNLDQVDLLFFEAVVNDDTNKKFTKAGAYSVEGVVRRVLRANSKVDIVLLYFIYEGFFNELRANKVPNVVLENEKVAEHYKIPSIDFTSEIWQRMQKNQFDWKTFGGTHPAPFGHRFYARAIENLLDMNVNNKPTSAKFSPEKLCANALDGGEYVDVNRAKIKSGWSIENPWKSKTKASVRSRFKGLKILETRKVGAEFELEFSGRAIGLYILSGDEAGVLEYSIDGGTWRELDTFTQWSNKLHLPNVIMLADDLPAGEHKLIVRMSAKKNPDSNGNACQIIKFAINR